MWTKSEKGVLSYQDQKWKIIQNKKSLIIFCICECGNRHDIHLDTKGNFIGRGTLLLKRSPQT